jgi:dipeptidyl aminopeptidase/acylaminoacyl peptidase
MRTAKRLTAKHDLEMGQGLAADQHPPRGGGSPPLAFAADGSIYAVAGRRGATILVRVTADGALEEITDPNRDVICGSATPDGRRFALTIGDVTTPGDLYLYDAGEGRVRRLWGPNDALLAEEPLGQVEEIWYEAFDGRKVHGWIVKPADFDPAKKYPLILEIHGGPHVPYGFTFFHEFRMLAAAGYVVLYTNPRGSTSYGMEFANLIQYRYPGDDFRDLMSGVDEVIRRGYIDVTRLGVTGGSGGGLLTNWVITRTDRFAAAVTQRCVSDWVSMYYSSDFALFTPTWFRKPPFEDIQEYLDRSPVTFASKITTPLMVVHSEDDWRTPIGQGEAMFRALKQQKKPTVMVRFPGESHELSRSGTPSRRVQRLTHIRRWFDVWLKGDEASEYGLEKPELAEAQAAAD